MRAASQRVRARVPLPPPQCMDQLLKELAGAGSSGGGGSSTTAGGGNPFKAFARRAQLVITGLVHISVLLLPRQLEEAGRGGSGAGAGSSGSSSGSSAKGGAGGRATGGGKAAAAGDAAEDTAAELAAAGFPADGSNLDEWQRVSSLW